MKGIIINNSKSEKPIQVEPLHQKQQRQQRPQPQQPPMKPVNPQQQPREPKTMPDKKK